MKVQQVKISALKFAEYNPRQLKEEQFEAIKTSIEKFGFVEPVVVNDMHGRKNTIVGGHQRVRVATALKFKEVPVVYVTLTEEQERELNIRLNKNVGGWDFDALANHFDTDDLLEWGFETWEIPDTNLLEPDQLIDGDKNAPPRLKITFVDFAQMERAEKEIKELLESKYDGAYYSVKAGEL